MQKTQFHQGSHKKNTPKHILRLGIALVAVFLILTSVINLAEKHFALQGRIEDLKNEQYELEHKKNALTQTNEYLQTPEGIERALREKYNLVKPGEEIIIITTDSSLPSESAAKSRIGRWWEAILHGLGIGG